MLQLQCPPPRHEFWHGTWAVAEESPTGSGAGNLSPMKPIAVKEWDQWRELLSWHSMGFHCSKPNWCSSILSCHKLGIGKFPEPFQSPIWVNKPFAFCQRLWCLFFCHCGNIHHPFGLGTVARACNYSSWLFSRQWRCCGFPTSQAQESLGVCDKWQLTRVEWVKGWVTNPSHHTYIISGVSKTLNKKICARLAILNSPFIFNGSKLICVSPFF